MSKIYGIFVLLFLLQYAPAAKGCDCLDQAKTQSEIAQCQQKHAGQEHHKLDKSYQALKNKYARHPVFLKKLSASQAAWEVYQAAQLEALFPAKHKQAAYGSSFGGCFSAAKEALIRERLKSLEALLQDPVEGDLCSFRP